jgi:two-component system response regulator PilR (NtrC family)
MMGPPKVLLACTDPESRQTLNSLLGQCGMQTVVSSSVRESRRILARGGVAMVFCEARLADGSFREVLRQAGARHQRVPVVVASRLDDTNQYLEAMRLGAFDFIACPYRRSEVEWIVQNALHDAGVVA